MNGRLLHLRPLSTSISTSYHLRCLSTSAPEDVSGNGKGPKTLTKETAPGSHRDMRRRFYVDAVVDKVLNGCLSHPYLMWLKTRAEFYRLLRSKRGCQLFRSSDFIREIHSSIQEEELNSIKRVGVHKICLGRSLSDHSRIKRGLYRYKYLSLEKAASEDAFLRGAGKDEHSQS